MKKVKTLEFFWGKSYFLNIFPPRKLVRKIFKEIIFGLFF